MRSFRRAVVVYGIIADISARTRHRAKSCAWSG